MFSFCFTAIFSLHGQGNMEQFIDNLMKKMTLEEKLGQLNLVTFSGSLITGPYVSEGAAEKIRKGQVGAILGLSGVDLLRKYRILQ